MRQLARYCLAIVSLFLALTAHAALIRDILDNPKAYAGQTVVVEGRVEIAFSLVLLRYFTVNDGSATLHVVTKQPLPPEGQRVRVAGRVHELFSLGSETLLVMVEEEAGSQGTYRAQAGIPLPGTPARRPQELDNARK